MGVEKSDDGTAVVKVSAGFGSYVVTKLIWGDADNYVRLGRLVEDTDFEIGMNDKFWTIKYLRVNDEDVIFGKDGDLGDLVVKDFSVRVVDEGLYEVFGDNVVVRSKEKLMPYDVVEFKNVQRLRKYDSEEEVKFTEPKNLILYTPIELK